MSVKDFSLTRIKRDLIEVLTSCQSGEESGVEILIPPSGSLQYWIIKINVKANEGKCFFHDYDNYHLSLNI
jgi:hypothetical protein